MASGVDHKNFGPAFFDPVEIKLARPERTQTGWRGEVIHIDHFGNIASNIRREELGVAIKHKEDILVRINGIEINGMVDTFGERPVGEVIALLGSTGNLIISVVNGNASQKLEIKVGDIIEAIIPSKDNF